jgi:hypothetical protein
VLPSLTPRRHCLSAAGHCELAGDGPQSFNVGVCLRRLGEVYEALHRPKEGAAAYQRSLEIVQQLPAKLKMA